MTGRDDCFYCEGFPDPILSPSSSLADIESHFNELLAQARLTSPPQILVLVPAPIRGYELYALDPGHRADMVRAAIGTYQVSAKDPLTIPVFETEDRP